VSDTIPDVTLASGVWLDVYNATGIAPGTALILKNKASNLVYIQVRATVPTASSVDGWTLAGVGSSSSGDWTTVDKVPAGSRVWVKGNGKLFVQVFE
jgi:hypothetical protein